MENGKRLIWMIVGGIFLIGAIGAVFSREVFLSRAEETTVVDLTDWRLEIADTDEERQQGLSGRDGLAPKTGMLFQFGKPGIYPFWMKDMKFALDIVWLDGDEVVEVATLKPPQETGFIPAVHIPTHRADTVLEINAGEAERLGLIKGNRVRNGIKSIFLIKMDLIPFP